MDKILSNVTTLVSLHVFSVQSSENVKEEKNLGEESIKEFKEKIGETKTTQMLINNCFTTSTRSTSSGNQNDSCIDKKKFVQTSMKQFTWKKATFNHADWCTAADDKALNMIEAEMKQADSENCLPIDSVIMDGWMDSQDDCLLYEVAADFESDELLFEMKSEDDAFLYQTVEEVEHNSVDDFHSSCDMNCDEDAFLYQVADSLDTSDGNHVGTK